MYSRFVIPNHLHLPTSCFGYQHPAIAVLKIYRHEKINTLRSIPPF